MIWIRDIISHLTSEYRPDFLGAWKIAGPDFNEHYYRPI
jgi:hypothetical protein